jgi:hypothetical protein
MDNSFLVSGSWLFVASCVCCFLCGWMPLTRVAFVCEGRGCIRICARTRECVRALGVRCSSLCLALTC